MMKEMFLVLILSIYDENRNVKATPVGGKCKASATFGVPTDSENLNVTFKRGNQKVAKIIVPINKI